MDDRIVGHRVGDGGRRVGAYQYTALASSGAIIDIPSDQKGEYLTLEWYPDTAGAILYYGFFPTLALAQAGFDLASDSPTSPPVTVVFGAPLWLERGEKDVTVPADGRNLFLRLEPSVGVGRVAVACSDRNLNITPPLE